MRDPYGEGPANRPGLAPCTVVGNDGGEALVRGDVGRVLSRENTFNSGRPTLLSEREGETGHTAMARCVTLLRGRRPRACIETPCAGTGRSHRWPRGDGLWVRATTGDRGR